GAWAGEYRSWNHLKKLRESIVREPDKLLLPGYFTAPRCGGRPPRPRDAPPQAPVPRRPRRVRAHAARATRDQPPDTAPVPNHRPAAPPPRARPPGVRSARSTAPRRRPPPPPHRHGTPAPPARRRRGRIHRARRSAPLPPLLRPLDPHGKRGYPRCHASTPRGTICRSPPAGRTDRACATPARERPP